MKKCSRDKDFMRDSNFELLRVISMLFIIFHHFIIFSNYDFIYNNVSGINNFLAVLFQAGGKFGVALFSMITGFYMIKSNINIRKIIMLEGQVLFYSIFLFLLFMIGGKEIGDGVGIKFFLPNIYEVYWFFSGYFILYLLIPYLNKMLLGLKKKEYWWLLGIGFVFLILLPNIFSNRVIKSGVIYLFYYYIIGAYIKLFGDKLVDKKYYLVGFFISYLMIPMFSLIMIDFAVSNIFFSSDIWMFSYLHSIFVFVSAICLFLYFKNLNIKKSKIINLLGSVSFGVYLFHEHPFVREFLFKKLFFAGNLALQPWFLLSSILIVVFIYLLGGSIDLIRQSIFKYFSNVIKKYEK